MDFGYIRVATAIPNVKVADCFHNVSKIENIIGQAADRNVEIITFPELCVTGYTCGDLFAQSSLLNNALSALHDLLEATKQTNIISIIGIPLEHNGTVLNTAAVLRKGEILGIVPKSYLPNYKEFYEKRWFASSFQTEETEINLFGQAVPMGTNLLFDIGRTKFGIEICEDLWAPVPPSSFLALKGAEIIFNLSADNEGVGKHAYLCDLIAQQSSRCIAGYVYSSCGFGESSTDVVFAGNALIYETGSLLAHNHRFSFDEQLVVSEIDADKIRNDRRNNTTFAECRGQHAGQTTIVHIAPATAPSATFTLSRQVDASPFVPSGDQMDGRCDEICSIQISGLAKRLIHTQAKTAVIGISGGLDSTLALLVCVRTFDKIGKDRKDIIGVTMPGFGTTDRTYHNAISLMQSLGVTIREISIKNACIQHFSDIGHNMDIHDITYENAQARERTQILMDIANQTGGLVIGTGDLSELALGWATYNGDHMSMYGINASVPKTLIRHLVAWIAGQGLDKQSQATLLDIVDTPISPELIPADKNGQISQKTEDLVGPYELHDFFLYHTLRNGFSPAKIYFLAKIAFAGQFDATTIKRWLTVFFRRFFAQQFKRSCLPDGPKVGLSLSPRGDWRMPSDASSRAWIEECGKL